MHHLQAGALSHCRSAVSMGRMPGRLRSGGRRWQQPQLQTLIVETNPSPRFSVTRACEKAGRAKLKTGRSCNTRCCSLLT